MASDRKREKDEFKDKLIKKIILQQLWPKYKKSTHSYTWPHDNNKYN